MVFWQRQLICSTALQRDSLDIISTEQHLLTHRGQCLSGKNQSLALLRIPQTLRDECLRRLPVTLRDGSVCCPSSPFPCSPLPWLHRFGAVLPVLLWSLSTQAGVTIAVKTCRGISTSPTSTEQSGKKGTYAVRAVTATLPPRRTFSRKMSCLSAPKTGPLVHLTGALGSLVARLATAVTQNWPRAFFVRMSNCTAIKTSQPDSFSLVALVFMMAWCAAVATYNERCIICGGMKPSLSMLQIVRFYRDIGHG